MRVIVSGSSGLVGSALVAALVADGHGVTRLVRRPPQGPDEARWDPGRGPDDISALEGADAAVHLAGAGIGERRWTEDQKRRIRQSRVTGTTALSGALAELDRPPAVLVSASAVGYYGDRGDEALTESSGPGRGFLAEVVAAWEGATEPAARSGIRVVNLRSAVVLSPAGGALRRVLPLFKLGLGGRLGSGRQWFSWVSIEDEVGLIRHAITNPDVRGPLNAAAPNPVSNGEYTRALGAAVHRPAVLAVPRTALRVAIGGGITDEMLLASQRVLPAGAQATGYDFRHPEIGAALRAVLGRT